MKKEISIAIFLIIMFSLPCYSQKQSLSGKEFLSESPIKSESFIFLDDSVCLYRQKYHCPIDENYRLIEIRCEYKVEREFISLNPIETPAYLEGSNCFIIPDSILKKCDLIYIDTPNDPFDLDIRAKLTKADIYGHINAIKDGTKLLLYKEDNIIFANVLTCIPVETRRSSFMPFTQKGKKRISDKTLNKLMKAQKIPINNLTID